MEPPPGSCRVQRLPGPGPPDVCTDRRRGTHLWMPTTGGPMRARGRSRVVAAAAVVAAVVTGATSVGAAPTKRAATPPRAKESIKAVIPGFERALRSGDCAELAEFALHSTRRSNPTNPGTAVDPN